MFRKNDMVQVMTGKEKGKSGKIIAIFPEKGRALVEKLNRVKRHQKPNQKMPQGGIMEKEASIHLSNLLLSCSKCGRGVRTRVKTDDQGKKQRICVKCREALG